MPTVRNVFLAVGCSLIAFSSIARATHNRTTGKVHQAAGPIRYAPRIGKTPLNFEQNVGQAEPQFGYIARGSGRSVSLTGTEAILRLRKNDGSIGDGCGSEEWLRPITPGFAGVSIGNREVDFDPTFSGRTRQL